MTKSLLPLALIPTLLGAQVLAIKAGHIVDPENGTASGAQTIVIEAGKFKEIGVNAAIPAGAEVIDLSNGFILPGLVDAHNHLALTYKRDPENNSYYLTTVLDSTAIRAIQAVSNGITMMSSGFTVVRDLGNNAELCRYRAPRGDRSGLDSGAHHHQFRTHHRRIWRPVSSHSGAAGTGISGVSGRRHPG